MGPILISIYIFVLAAFVGFGLISKVAPLLHTPLLSALNAISGISLVGAIISMGAGSSWGSTVLGILAVVLATITVVGGFRLTDRMLGMFQSDTVPEKGQNNCKH